MWLPESETPEIDISGIKQERAWPVYEGNFISEHVRPQNPAVGCATVNLRRRSNLSEAGRGWLFVFLSPTVFIFPFVMPLVTNPPPPTHAARRAHGGRQRAALPVIGPATGMCSPGNPPPRPGSACAFAFWRCLDSGDVAKR